MIKIERNEPCSSMDGLKRVELLDATKVYYTLPKDGGVECMVKQEWGSIDFERGDASYRADSGEGGSYSVEVTLTCKSTSRGYEQELDKMRQRRFVLRVTDNNGIAWIVGRKEEPLRFSYSHSNNGGIGGTRNYALRFYCQTHYAAGQER